MDRKEGQSFLLANARLGSLQLLSGTTDLLLQVRLEFLRPFMFRQEHEHLSDALEALGGRTGFAVGLFSLEVLRRKIGRHGEAVSNPVPIGGVEAN